MTGSAADPKMAPRSLRPGQRARVWIAKIDGGPPELVYSADTVLLEAPDWLPDGRGLLLTGQNCSGGSISGGQGTLNATAGHRTVAGSRSWHPWQQDEEHND